MPPTQPSALHGRVGNNAGPSSAIEEDSSRGTPDRNPADPLDCYCPFKPLNLAQSSAQTQARFQHRPDWPDPQSQSFSRSYGSNLPTSLTYISLSTRGFLPRRPDADMGTHMSENRCFTYLGEARFS